MAANTISKRELKNTVKEGVREVLTQELMSLRALLLPFVSESEQRDIEKRYVKPVRKPVRTKNIQL